MTQILPGELAVDDAADLTLLRADKVKFVEVKGPSDSFHASQARLISKLLLPLGFNVSLAEVRKRS